MSVGCPFVWGIVRGVGSEAQRGEIGAPTRARSFPEAVIAELGGALVVDHVHLPHAHSLDRIASLHSSPAMRAGALEELSKLARSAGAVKLAGNLHRRAMDVPGSGGPDRMGINSELAAWTAEVADATGAERQRLVKEQSWFAGATLRISGAEPGTQMLACSVAKRHLDADRPELALSYYDAASQIAETHGDQRGAALARAGIDVAQRRLGLAREPLGGRAYSTVQTELGRT